MKSHINHNVRYKNEIYAITGIKFCSISDLRRNSDNYDSKMELNVAFDFKLRQIVSCKSCF